MMKNIYYILKILEKYYNTNFIEYDTYIDFVGR